MLKMVRAMKKSQTKQGAEGTVSDWMKSLAFWISYSLKASLIIGGETWIRWRNVLCDHLCEEYLWLGRSNGNCKGSKNKQTNKQKKRNRFRRYQEWQWARSQWGRVRALGDRWEVKGQVIQGFVNSVQSSHFLCKRKENHWRTLNGIGGVMLWLNF